jgi:spermidine/putrescine transport system substrate-binding protein
MRFRALAAAVLLLAGCSRRAPVREVRLFTWGNYDDPRMFAEFERSRGIRVAVSRFASNEEMLAKLMGGGRGYDLITPSDYMVAVMIRQGLLWELDKRRLPNLRHIDRRFLDLYFDRGNRFSVPYLWGLTGIGYDSERVRPAPESWSVFWDPRHRNRISLLNDQREVFAMGLLSMGRRADEHDPAVLSRVKDRLAVGKELVKAFVSENMEALLLSGELDVIHVWSGDLNQARGAKPSLRFVIPREGGIIWQDNFVIPSSARDKEAALELVNFLLEPRIAARTVEKILYGTPNKSAWPLLPEGLRSDFSIVPQEDVFRRLQWIPDAGEAARVYDRLWTEVKAL